LPDNRRVKQWPADWEERKRGKDCPICADGRPDEFHFGIRVYSTDNCDAYLQRHGTVRGYTVALWRGGRHVAEPMELSDDEAAGYWRDVLRVAGAVERHYQPMKVNLEMLGNTIPHLHTHIRPRHRNDPAPFGPLAHAVDPPAFPEAQLRADAAALTRLLKS
jgi:diadenosine tetraphosphate (Ap4A) HIT family hydrolase